MKYMKKLMQILNKKGKQTIAVKNVNRSIEKLKKVLPPSRLINMFRRLTPGVKIYKKKVAGKVYQIPSYIKENRSCFQTAKWLALALEKEKKGIKFSVKLSKLIWQTAKTRGLVWELRKQYVGVIKENRSYMRFIRKKRKKRKKFVFQQRSMIRMNKIEFKKKKQVSYDKIIDRNRKYNNRFSNYDYNRKSNFKLKKHKYVRQNKKVITKDKKPRRKISGINYIAKKSKSKQTNL